MKEIVVISGKGGTGKTSITASFAVLGGKDIVVADCDVDAADMHLLMQPDFNICEDFYSGEVAVIDQHDCIQCGECAKVCRFDAIPVKSRMYSIDNLSCEGCGYCARVCPTEAIVNEKRLAGKYFVSKIKSGSFLVHARLDPGADNSGKLVAKVKNGAREMALEQRKELILVDGPPGIGCPVVSSLSGAHYVVLVTEPTISGLHDLMRVYELVGKFGLRSGCIINKADINTEKTREVIQFLKDRGIEHIASIPYNERFTEAMVEGLTIVEYDQGILRETLTGSWNKIKQLAKNINTL